MKLYYSPASPYVRKCLITAHELGLANRIQIAPVMTVPTAHNPELMRDNPLCKLPTLVMDDGLVLYDSRVICEYLNEVGNGALLPAAARWTVQVEQALADGILDAALLTRYEDVLRPAEFQWPAWRDAQVEKIRSALAHFERGADSMAGRIDLSTIGLASALAYLDLRFPDLDWRTANPGLTGWFGEFEQRPSMLATQFKA